MRRAMSLWMTENTVDAVIGDEEGPHVVVSYDRDERMSEVAAVGPSGQGVGINLGPDEVADLIAALDAMLMRMRFPAETPHD